MRIRAGSGEAPTRRILERVASAPMSGHRKFYDLLGLKTTTPSEAELKAAYKKAAKKFHPDRNPEQRETAERKFKEISEA